MKTQRNGGILLLTLEASCGIETVEEDAALLREELADPAVRRLDINAGDLETMDTAYFQLLLAARQEMKKRGGRAHITPVLPCFTEILTCYGLKFD